MGAAAAASRAARPAALTEVSEWAVDEVMAACGLSARAAGGAAGRLGHPGRALPATLDALEDGAIDWPQARMLAEVLGPVDDGGPRRGGAPAAGPGREGRTVASVDGAPGGRCCAADAAAAAAAAGRGDPGPVGAGFPGDDGMGTLSAAMPLPVAAGLPAGAGGLRRGVRVPGDQRTKDQRMVDCLAELILRPGESTCRRCRCC